MRWVAWAQREKHHSQKIGRVGFEMGDDGVGD